LISLRQVRAFDGHAQRALARHHSQIAHVHGLAITRHGTHGVIARALREHEVYRPLPLQLQAQRTVELQCRRQQDRRRYGLAERVANGRRVFTMLEHRAPCGIQVDQVPTNRIVLEKESV